MLTTILVFVLVLSVLVFAHEFGHFIVAKKSGMTVEEFGFGFPPKLAGWKWRGTEYTINLIPLGGFVRIKGESGSHKDQTDSFSSKPLWKRFLVLIAGVTMNMVLAAVLLSIGFMIGLPTGLDGGVPAGAQVRNQELAITTVVAGSPAARAGLKMDDVVVSLDNQTFTDAAAARAHIAASGLSGVVTKFRETDGSVKEVTVVAEDLPTVGIHGVGVGLVSTGLVSFPFPLAVWHGFGAAGRMFVDVANAFVTLIRNLIVIHEPGGELAGPVGIAVMTGQAADLGFIYLLQFMAMLSVNLAVVNLLPFPALDGGRIVFVLYEWICRRPASVRTESIVHGIGFATLMIIILFVTFNDILKFATG